VIEIDSNMLESAVIQVLNSEKGRENPIDSQKIYKNKDYGWKEDKCLNLLKKSPIYSLIYLRLY